MERAGFLNWLLAFGLTQLIEMPIYRRGLAAKYWEAFGASALTNPIVCFIIPGLWRSMYAAGIQWDGRLRLSPGMYLLGYGVLAEGFAVLGEVLWFWGLGKKNPWRWAFIANFASAATGLILHFCLGWPSFE